MKKLYIISLFAFIGLSANALSPAWQWAKSAGGINIDYGKSITVVGSGNSYVIGSFESSSITFGSTTLTNAGYEQFFIVKLSDASTGITELANDGNTISVFPNPFSNSTTISFSLAQSEKVSVKIFNETGRLVKILVDESMKEGKHSVVWNIEDKNEGFYLLKFDSENCSKSNKLMVIK